MRVDPVVKYGPTVHFTQEQLDDARAMYMRHVCDVPPSAVSGDPCRCPCHSPNQPITVFPRLECTEPNQPAPSTVEQAPPRRYVVTLYQASADPRGRDRRWLVIDTDPGIDKPANHWDRGAPVGATVAECMSGEHARKIGRLLNGENEYESDDEEPF